MARMLDTGADVSTVTEVLASGDKARPRAARRYVRLGGLLLVALLAAVIVTSVTVDLGPSLRAQAERAGSRAVGRPMRIGKLSIYLFLGRFLVEDLVIEGPTPADRPFLRAGRIVVSMPWSALLHGEVLFESIEMSDWAMVVESFPGNRHTFPSLGRPGREAPEGERRFVTTLSYVRAFDGEFTYEDHAAPWSTVARNLDITVTKSVDYRGEASFSDGTVQIGDFEPMRADMRADFKIDGGNVVFDHLDLRTDGARSLMTGVVDVANWPAQRYEVRSQLEFPVLRDIFFARDRFTVAGEGEFIGTFELYRGGRELEGRFSSELAHVDGWPFPRLEGALEWRRDRFRVYDARSELHGGTLDFTYAMAPLGGVPGGRASLDTTFTDVDLRVLTDFLDLRGLRLEGWASGRNLLEWPLGEFAERSGDGALEVRPPPGIDIQSERLPALPAAAAGDPDSLLHPADSPVLTPLEGEIGYRYGPEAVDIAPGSWLASPRTRVTFEGRTAYGGQSRLPFHVTSSDWQESDRLLAAILTALGNPTRIVRIGGGGTFDGVMAGRLSAPRITGRFDSLQTRVWDVAWGHTAGDVVIEDGYVDVSGGRVTRGESEVLLDGRFAVGYPRADGGDEIDARIQIVDRPVVDFRRAFNQVEYDVEGRLSGEFHLYGVYRSPFGFGRITIDEVVAYGEPFDRASAGLRFEGSGVRVDGVEIHKGRGTITGAAYVDWIGTYSFNADGRRIPLDRLAVVSGDTARLSGALQFSASGVGAFDAPVYEIRGRVDDLFVRDEGIGQVTGRIDVRGGEARVEVEAASPRLAVSGSGRVALTPEADAELSIRFTDTSLDPYVRAFEPRLSPFTTAVASGALRVVGELRNLDHLLVDGQLEQLELTLFDYDVRNDGPIRLALDSRVARIERMQLTGEGTELDLAGVVDLAGAQIDVRATGDANLGILQGFFRDVRSSGNAEVVARIRGPLRAPVLTGFAAVSDGRVRHFSLPHALEAIGGRITFDAAGVHLDGLEAELGGGRVRFGGVVGLSGYLPAALNVRASGERLQLRYPEGFRSVVDAELALQGEFSNPLLSGRVEVVDAVWVERLTTDSGLFGFGGEVSGVPAPPAPSAPTIPLRLDVRVDAPASLRVEDNDVRIISSAELVIGGTYDQPRLLGYLELDRGEVFFEGNRYVVRRGSIEFTNPREIEPFFDIEAETSVRVPGQIYRIVFHAAGTTDRFVPELTSDPPLPTIDILSLLFGDVRDPQEGELRAIQAPEETEQQLFQTRAARLLASPISAGVGRVVEESIGVDTFQITPSLVDPSAQQSAQLSPSARVTIGKRISGRAYLTLSRALTGSERDLIVLLEYDQSDRLSWVFSQNEDRTYALDFRVRHAF